jgi:putative endonuclease
MNYRPPGGAKWEQIAESFLHGKGLSTVERNFRCRLGEIDLIMQDGPTLVFTEVRYRRSDRFGSGAESVTHAKQARIIRAAQRFLQYRPLHPNQACRFDVISIGPENQHAEINWIRGAFDAF